MLVSINPTDSRPIYQQIMHEIRRGIVVGSLGAEDPLPSVRQLAAELKINPNTVQQAYRELEREGVVHVRRGRGTFVTGVRSQDAERRQLARSLAERALHEAYRHGLDAGELIEAVRRAERDALARDKETQ